MHTRIQSLLLGGLLTLACLLLPCCIDGNEEIHINRDGSGTASATYFVPVAAVAASGGAEELRATLENWAAGQDGLVLESLEIGEQGDQLRIHSRLSFRSAFALIDASTPEQAAKLPAAARHLAGNVDFRLRGRRIEMSRTVNPRAALGAAMLFSTPGDLGEHRLSYQISMPVAPDSHNATSTRDNGRTLVWEFPLDEAVKSPQVMTLTARIPIPWWVWPVAAAVLALLVFAITALIRRLTGRR